LRVGDFIWLLPWFMSEVWDVIFSFTAFDLVCLCLDLVF
jgi:hypothetical protein